MNAGLEVATFGAGCFWGVEHIFRRYYLGNGIVDTAVGYSGGNTANPTYEDVCTHTTNHVEVVQILFDPRKVRYETLVDFFFRIHDPTTQNRQGPDVGVQYKSVVFTHSPEQESVAKSVREKLQKTFYKKKIMTIIEPISNWYDAEDYHQQYLHKNPSGYECPTHYLREAPEI